MAVQIQFRRGTASEWTQTNPILALAEMGIELDTNLFKIGDGVKRWEELPYGGVKGYTGSASTVPGPIANLTVSNVLYVSKSGNDNNDGKSIATTKLTIRAALEIATRGTTIFVKSGDYTEINPLVVPDFVSIIGDNLRSVTVRPATVTDDLFYVNNGVYLAHMTFKDHIAPAAAVAFPADGSAGVISTSPYVQNCTSMTTTGTGMRVDGDLAEGTKSMVVDAYTQYNQGGVGIHMLNKGYTQLVSVFTICCDKGFLCETGGSCSITNSNSSFGNYALYADGVGSVEAVGKLVGNTIGRIFTVTNLTSIPAVGDALGFGDGSFYTIASADELTIGDTIITYPSVLLEDASLRNARQLILSELSTLKVKTIQYVLKTFPGFDFNQFKCSRDVGTIITSITYDMVLNTNYQTVLAGNSYYRAVSSEVTGNQFTETLAAIEYLKILTLALVQPGTAYTRLNTLFDILITRFKNQSAIPAYNFTPPTGAIESTVNAVAILQANKEFIKVETTEYINNFTYNTTSCIRDTGLIIDGIAFDLLYGGFSQSTFAGLQYWNQDVGYVDNIQGEITTLTNALSYVKDQAIAVVENFGLTAATTVTNLFALITDILTNGPVDITNTVIPNSYPSTDQNIIDAYTALVGAQNTIANDTITYINTTSSGFSYDEETCARDVRYIIQSVAFDLLHSGNRQSIMSGVYYYGYDATDSVINGEVTQTIAAYKYLNDTIKKLVVGQLTGPVYQRTVLPTLSTSTATTSETLIIDNIVTTLTNIISEGPSVAGAKNPIPLVASTLTFVQNAFDLILDNRAFLQAEVTGFLTNKFKVRTYNTASCYRDTGLIVDSIAFDIAYGGVSQSTFAGLQYWSQTTSTQSIIPDELTTTTNAINHMRDIMASYVETASNTSTRHLFESKINKIVSIMNNGFDGTFVYDEVKCRRDTGLIIDAVVLDLLFNGETQTTFAGVQYWNHGGYVGSISGELTTTTNAINYLNSLSKKIILNDKTGTRYTTGTQNTSLLQASTDQQSFLNEEFLLITRILTSGTTGVTDLIIPNGITASTDVDVQRAYALLRANKTYLQEEVVAYVNATKTPGFVYDQIKCYRDVGYMIDSVSFDLLYGGNLQAIQSGVYYWSFNDASTALPGERDQAIAAYDYIKFILPLIIKGDDILETYQNTVPQVLTGGFGTSIEVTTAQNLISIINDIVLNGPQVANEPAPIGLVRTTSTNVLNAALMIRKNKNFIIEETIAFIDFTFGNVGISDMIVPNGIASTATSIVSAYDAIVANKSAVVTETMEWISTTTDFVFNTITCARDLGYILDSVAFDVLHGGNRQSIMSAVYYFGYNEGDSALSAEEIPATLAAYQFVKELSQKVILGTVVAYPYQTSVTQVVSQNTGTLAEVELIDISISTITNIISNGPSVAGPKTPINLTISPVESTVNSFELLLDNRQFIQAETIAFINMTFGNLFYNVDLCKRDIEYVLDAVSYDLMYGGNSQTVKAADAYYDGGGLKISTAEQPASVVAFAYIGSIMPKILTNQEITPRQNVIFQNTSLPISTLAEGNTTKELLSIVARVIDEAYTSVVTLAEFVPITIGNNSVVTFQKFSLIQSSAHNFEWIGAGTDINAALPYLGGVPITENQAFSINGGKVYFTGTDQRGNFQIGNELTINNNLGTISGRTFTKSLFAVMTPYILAIGG